MGGNHSSQDSSCSDMYDSDPDMDVDVNACSNRLVNWVTELLLVDIRKIVSTLAPVERKGNQLFLCLYLTFRLALWFR